MTGNRAPLRVSGCSFSLDRFRFRNRGTGRRRGVLEAFSKLLMRELREGLGAFFIDRRRSPAAGKVWAPLRGRPRPIDW